jgi:hypothetical protein
LKQLPKINFSPPKLDYILQRRKSPTKGSPKAKKPTHARHTTHYETSTFIEDSFGVPCKDTSSTSDRFQNKPAFIFSKQVQAKNEEPLKKLTRIMSDFSGTQDLQDKPLTLSDKVKGLE